MSDVAFPGQADAETHTDELIDQVIRMQRTIHRLKSSDSARSAHAILLMISMDGPQRVADLAIRMCVDASTVSRQTAWLVSDGLLRRTSDPADGRASVLALTERGQSVAATVAQRRRDLFTRAVHDWSVRDVQTFATLLRRFVDGLERNVPSAAGESRPVTVGETA